MDRYHIALFLHLVTLIVAGGATAVTKLAVGRRMRARTAADALDWHDVLASASKLFPICLVLFTASGSYMVSMLGARAWSSGFVIAGLVGVILLLGSGTFLGIKGKAVRDVLQAAVDRNPDGPPPRLIPPPLIVIMPMVNTAIAIAVAFVMTTKPASVAVALGIIAFAIVSSGTIAWLKRPRPAAGRAVGAHGVPNEAAAVGS